MALIKICPCCQAANPASELMCQACAALIADVAPVEDGSNAAMPGDDGSSPASANISASDPENSARDIDATVIVRDVLTFSDQNNKIVFHCPSGEIIGRNGAGAEYLQQFNTVSRKHCIVRLGSDGWGIEDCGSSNGTYVNGRRISGLSPISDNDLVELSHGCALRVKL